MGSEAAGPAAGSRPRRLLIDAPRSRLALCRLHAMSWSAGRKREPGEREDGLHSSADNFFLPALMASHKTE